MKIFQILGGDDWGGGGLVVLALTEALQARGAQVWVLVAADRVEERFQMIGAQTVRLPSWRRAIHPWRDLQSLWALFRLCRRERFDLVVTHTSKGGILGRMAARLAGVRRVIHTVHGFAFHEFTPTWLKQVYVGLERWAAGFCDLLISVNQEDRRRAIEHRICPPEKIVSVRNGIDLARFASIPPPAETGQPPWRIGAVGRLTRQKGFEYLIQALPLVLALQHETELWLAGSGPLEKELQAQARELGVDERLHLQGFSADIPAFLSRLDVFVLPSLWEGLSITLLEAMAAARPIIATNIKGNREVLRSGQDGILVAPADPQALAEAIVALLRDRPRAARLARAARRRVAQEFSIERMVEETLFHYGLTQRLATEAR